MKELILNALQYPGYLIRENFDPEHCVHGGNYNRHDHLCRHCDSAFECLWLSENDECAAQTEKSVPELMCALEAAQGYIDGEIAEQGHNIGKCQCDACHWLRQAELLYNIYYRQKQFEQ